MSSEKKPQPVAWRYCLLMQDSMGGWERKIEPTDPRTLSYIRQERLRDIEPLYSEATIEALRAERDEARKRSKSHWEDLQLVWDGILGKGPFCRDCADEAGICPSSKLPCDPTEAAVAQALIWKNEVEAAEAQVAQLEAALRDARDEVEHWGQYASEYIQEKHGLKQALTTIDRALLPDGGRG